MILEGIRCVVFDIDDTLYLEREYIRSGFEAIDRWLRTTHCIEGFFAVAWRKFEDGSRGRIFNETLDDLGYRAHDDTVSSMVAVYRNHQPNIALLSDARDCLDRLEATGIAMACLSDGPLESQDAKSRALGLQRWMDPIILTARCGEGYAKPSIRGFARVSETRGVAGAACMYVGDNPSKDFCAPRQLGWCTARVRRGGSLHEAVESGSDVDFELADLRDIGK